ncbi:MAG: hypothetical protein QG665_334 [Patescibacteria group bacterium]|nr:hypothetical protein [Patescibacteria group bacterium]
MLTPEQEQWLDSLSDRLVTIVPYDPQSEELFKIVKEKIVAVLGNEVKVEHSGSTLFHMPGQDEIDVAIVADKEMFSQYIEKLEPVFGPVRSLYPDRARFEVKEQGKKIDLKLVDRHHPNYIEGKLLDDYIMSHPEALERYRILKEESDGLTNKEYYRRKLLFNNDILAKAKSRGEITHI